MNGMQPEIGRLNAPAKPGGLGAAIFVALFGLPFAAFGLCALFFGISKIAGGSYKDGGMIALFGLIFSSVGFLFVAGSIWGWKKLNRDAAMQARFPDRPWMLRRDWAEGKIKPTATAPIAAYLVWSFMVLAASIPAICEIPKAFEERDPGILLVLIFPVVAGGLWIYTFVQWRARHRFGDCFFEPAQTPTPLGGVLEGTILTGKSIKLEHDLYLKLSCIRRSVSGCGKERHVTETPLWEDEKIYRADVALPEPEPGHSGIPVHFKLPANQPECFSHGEESVFWRLEAKTKMRGIGFHVAFDVPVFKIAGAAIEPDDSDPTTPLQAPMEDVRRDGHSRIRVSDGPGGREFYFPPARNVGTCISVTIFALAFSGIAVLTYEKHAPILFPIAFGCFGLLLTFFTLNAWLKSSRVTINSSGLDATNHWLFLRRSQHFDIGDIERFDLSIGTTSGNRAFWNIKLIKRVGDVTLANDIADRAEAAWLVQQMTKALNRLENQGQVFTVR